MSRLLLVALLVTALVVAGRSLVDEPPDGPLRVVTGEPVRVVLPVNASPADIAARTTAAIDTAAQSARTPEMRAELVRLAADRSAIRRIGSEGHASLASGEAAALAFPWFRVDASTDRLTIYTVTVELIPGLPGMAVNRDHEDGHAEVNDQLALRCGPRLAEEHIGAGRRGAALEAAIAGELRSLAEAAHDLYHSLVEGASLGTHLRRAREAGATVAAEHCS
jgi:hypothetical protein